MGNTHDTEIARIEADYIKTKYRSQGDYRWGYTGDRGNSMRSHWRNTYAKNLRYLHGHCYIYRELLGSQT